jgi:hypothetical protein
MAAVNRLRAVSTANTKPRSSEREALAAAIAELAGVEKEAGALTEALRNADKAVRDARRHVEAKTEAVERAKKDSAHFETQRLLGKTDAAPLSIKAARTQLVDAEDELDTAEATLAALQARGNERYEVEWARHKVAGLAQAILLSEAAEEIHQRFEAAYRQYASARSVLRFIESISPPRLQNPFRDRLPSTAEVPDHPADEPWREALKALLQDADAVLPEIQD